MCVFEEPNEVSVERRKKQKLHHCTSHQFANRGLPYQFWSMLHKTVARRDGRDVTHMFFTQVKSRDPGNQLPKSQG